MMVSDLSVCVFFLFNRQDKSKAKIVNATMVEGDQNFYSDGVKMMCDVNFCYESDHTYGIGMLVCKLAIMSHDNNYFITLQSITGGGFPSSSNLILYLRVPIPHPGQIEIPSLQDIAASVVRREMKKRGTSIHDIGLVDHPMGEYLLDLENPQVGLCSFDVKVVNPKLWCYR